MLLSLCVTFARNIAAKSQSNRQISDTSLTGPTEPSLGLG